MSQTTLDDDELFSEAASEMREDVETALAAARASLPDGDAIWTVEADNVLGALNALRSALDAGDAVDHLRDAKKWYTLGQRADAFEDASDLEDELQAVEELIEGITTAHEQVSEVAATLPELRGQLDAVDGGGDEDEE